jgi:hypothetical protein
MVMQKIAAMKIWFRAMTNPSGSHKMLNKQSQQQQAPPLTHNTPSLLTSLSNGSRLNEAILKHCLPNGIPMMVRHSTNPTNHHNKAEKKPPSTNQTIFLIGPQQQSSPHIL